MDTVLTYFGFLKFFCSPSQLVRFKHQNYLVRFRKKIIGLKENILARGFLTKTPEGKLPPCAVCSCFYSTEKGSESKR